MYVEPPVHVVREAVARAIAEDLAPIGDVTSALLDPTVVAECRVVAREAGSVAGTACAVEAFAQIDPAVEVTLQHRDGDRVEPGDVLANVSGPLRSILTAERTALNFLGHLSGIATLTARYVAAAKEGGRAQVWDTRKTTPGLRTLEKAAVRAGGGRNHRGNLSEWILLKDNHIAGIGIAEAVRRAKDLWPARTVHIECDRLEQALEAVDAGASAVLLDNMTPEQVAECVAAVRGRCLLEVSGGVTLETIASYSATGIDLISVGRITNSAPVLDVGLDI
ncbi:MAG: carboxylating nicotinate-nucleotide diphosphorylase [Microthrixaceae bacterium]|nr:carboxylating nicotinate-nucleotide diphosphorylase [Microthrixaceae bacterium]